MMEVRFCSKHHTLAFTSSNLPSPSSISPNNLRSLRRQFLGCCNNLRPPGSLRSRRTEHCNNLGLVHFRSAPRFIVRASFTPDSVLVIVAIVTFSAVSLAYFTRKRRRRDSKQILWQPTYALEMGSNIKSQVIDSHIMGLEDVERESLVEKGELLKDGNKENSDACEDISAQLTICRSSTVQQDNIMTKKLHSPSTDVLGSNFDTSSSLLNESNVTDQPFSALVFEPVIEQPLIFTQEQNQSQKKDNQDEIESDSELVIQGGKSSVVSDTVNYDSFLSKSIREELHMFYDANKSVTGFLTSISTRASFSIRKEASSPLRNTTVRGSDASTHISLQTADYVGRNVPIASHKDGPPSPHQGSKPLKKGSQILRDKERSHLEEKSDLVLTHFSHPKGTHFNEKDYLSEQFSIYNRLLEDGRLSECIILLKNMETRGILDTRKVHHAKFFNFCKRQKAVREAFDFIKLIPNPKLSTFNMLMSVCASSQDSEGGFQVLRLVQQAGLQPDCKLYTTLISTCAKSGKVDQMFEVFHEMVNFGIEPNVHTYGALIDGCAKAGQVAKAFGAYGMLRSKNVKPDRVVFNALITACGQSGAVDRAFGVLEEMADEPQPIDPDHITLGALMKACADAGQVERAREVYRMIHQYNIVGTPEVYTIAVNSCGQNGDWEFACSVYRDMTKKGVIPDEMFLSALIDVAGHAGKLDAAFEILEEAKDKRICVGVISYSSLMGACSNAKSWERAIELYEYLKSIKLMLTVSTVNALITSLCEAEQFQKAIEVLSEMKELGVRPNSVTYSVLLAASEKKDDIEASLSLFSQAKKDSVAPSLMMCRCITGMLLRRYEKACSIGESVLSFNSGRPQVDNKWTSLALMVYRETVAAGEMPTTEILSQLLGCMKLPSDASLKKRIIEDLGVNADRSSNLCSLIDGFGEYDTRSFSLLEEAASLGIVSSVSFKESPIFVDMKMFQVYIAEVYLLTVLKGLKHRLAAGARLPNITILVPIEKTVVVTPKGEKTIKLASRVSQAVAALLRRLRIPYQGSESNGKIRINWLSLKKWLQPKLVSPFGGKPGEMRSFHSRLGKSITHQQRSIRTGNWSLD